MAFFQKFELDGRISMHQQVSETLFTLGLLYKLVAKEKPARKHLYLHFGRLWGGKNKILLPCSHEVTTVLGILGSTRSLHDPAALDTDIE